MKIKQILELTDGRDKALKILQYAMLLYINLRGTRKMFPKLAAFVSALSVSRKAIRLGHFLYPLSSKTKTIRQKLQVCLEVALDILDDVLFLAKIKAIDEYWFVVEPYANKLWATCICLDLQDSKTTRSKLKLGSDLVFVMCDIMNLETKLQTIAGLTSAVLSFYSVYLKVY